MPGSTKNRTLDVHQAQDLVFSGILGLRNLRLVSWDSEAFTYQIHRRLHAVRLMLGENISEGGCSVLGSVSCPWIWSPSVVRNLHGPNMTVTSNIKGPEE